jgi:hypothetical protein
MIAFRKGKKVLHAGTVSDRIITLQRHHQVTKQTQNEITGL